MRQKVIYLKVLNGLLLLTLIVVPVNSHADRVVAFADANSTKSTCTQKVKPITTKKGSKKVRDQINYLYKETFCTKSRLDAALKTNSARYYNELAAFEKNKTLNKATNDKNFKSCTKRFRITEGDLLNAKLFADKTRFNVPYGPQFPCYLEYETYLKTDSKPSLVLPWTHLATWIKSWQDLYLLVDRYPDSVHPSMLSHVLRGGKNAMACDPTKVWCYSP